MLSEKKDLWYNYVCYFFVFALVGWLYELGWELKVGNGFVNRGYLHGFYLPVYGFGGLLLILCLQQLMKRKIRIWKINITPILVFLSIMIIVSLVEYLTSYVMETIYNKRWWDYSYDKFNLNGRISLRNSTLLSLGGMGYLYILYPALRRLLSHINKKVLLIIAVAIIVVMGVDFITVIMGY